MGCVNKASKEFKELAAKHNLSSNGLELIVHKYWIENGNETLFPTDVYIQAQLGNTHYIESGRAVRQYWKMRYNSPKTFTSMNDLQAAYREAAKYFPESAIIYYKDANNNFVLSVKRPVEHADYTKDSFFEEMDNIGSVKDIKTIDLNIDEDQSYGIDKVQQIYNRFNTDRTSQALADRAFNIAKELGLSVSFGETLPFGVVGRYTNDNTLIYKKSFLERDIMNNKKASIILHEVLHALSMYALSNQTKNWKRPEALEEFRTEMNSLYQDLKSNPLLKDERGIIDINEFVAELANPIFREKIKEIDKKNKTKKSFWQRVLDAFKSLLGLHTSNSYYQRSMNALDKALDAFDIDTYMRYNGVKNQLRQGFNAKEWEFKSMSDKEVKSNVINYFDKQIYDNEMLSLKEKAIADGTFMKAPNGKATNLSERQWLQVRTQNFKEWFGDWEKDPKNASKVVDENGEPLVVYHGGENNIFSFMTYHKDSEVGDMYGAYFTKDKKYAKTYNKGTLYDVFLNIKNPLVTEGNWTGIINGEQKNGITSKHDGIINDKFDKGILQKLHLAKTRTEIIVFDPNQIKSATDNTGEFSTSNLEIYNYELGKEFIDSMSGKQIKDELGIIQQESADYNLVNGIEEEKKHSGKATPQDFTFADGTTIKAPFHPNAQQVDALNAMDAFIKSNETSMTLSGYAGTGKTSLMEMIAKKCRQQHRAVSFCATTNKAAAVLNDRVSKAGFKASTLNKLFGISVELDSKSQTYNARNLVNNLRDNGLKDGTTVIIDEASMINEENYGILKGIAEEKNLKIIYVGDEAQLAPVNEEKISKVFRNGDGKVVRLTQVERTDDNAILKEATDIRNGKPLSGETSFNSKGEGVAYIAPEHKNAINEVIEHYIKGLKDNPNFFRILAYTNKAVANYNNQVRKLLGYNSPIPNVGEPMVGYTNWGYEYLTKSWRFINSESYTVTKIDKPVTVKATFIEGKPVFMEATPITLKDSMGKIDTFNLMDIKNNPQNREAAILLANEKKRLWAETKRVVGKQAKAKIYQKINAIDSFLFVNDNIEDGRGNLLQAKTIDFGYALTIHKSQGSTFTHVLMDDADVSKAALTDNNAANAWSIVGVGEESHNAASEDTLKGVSEEIDLGDLSGVNGEAKAPNQVANIKQQLEYVGVSRATDTVTIISNDIKKEGSPLHPEKNVKSDIINNNNQRSDDKVVNTLVDQVVAHMKSIGLPVKNRAAIAEFLKTHKIEGLQQMVSNYYMSLDDAKEIEALRHDLFSKFRNKSSFGCIGHTANYWYLCDYFGDSTYKVRAQIFIDGNERLINEFENEIRGETFRSAEDFSRRLEAFKSSQGQHNNGWSDVKVRITTNGNAKLAGREFQSSQDTNQGRSDGHSSIYNAESGIEAFMTPQGEVYGFVDKDGNIYLDETKISPNHAIHEYTHLWDRTVQKKNPKLWQKGIELIKQTSLWETVLNEDNYGKVWQSMNLPQEKLESLIASEVHSRLVGENGEKLLNNLAKQKGQEGIIGKLKQWILDMWKEVKATFGNWSQEEIDQLTLKDFNHMTVRDLADGIKLKDVSEATYETTQVDQQQSDTNNTKEAESTVENPSFSEGETQKVSLPGYEYFNELYDDTPVDAEWKIPYLKELDAQLSMDKFEQETYNILNQMDTVLKATSKEEYLQEKNSPKQKKIDKQLEEFDKLTQQINNLLEGKEFDENKVSISATEVRHVAELVANSISDMITRLQEEEGSAEKLFPAIQTKLDFKNASRSEIIEAVDINSLIEKAKENFSPEVTDYEDMEVMIQAHLLTQNWDAVMHLASDIFAFNEGMGIRKDLDSGNYILTVPSKIDYDNFNDYSNDMDIAAESGEKDEQEHWQVESRTIDVLSSMSALVRQGLHECYILDKDGNRVISKWGNIPERVNPRKAVNSLLRWTQGSTSLEDMVAKLSSKQQHNPWLSQLITRLSDKTGKETDFQSQFYGVFQKHFQPYSIVLLENGKYYSMMVNGHTALTDVMRNISSQFKIGEHPLFGNSSINSKMLGNENTIGKNAAFNLHKANVELNKISVALKQGDTLDDEMAKTATENIVGVCRSLGFMVSEDMVADIADAENIQSMSKYLNMIVEKLDAVAKEQKLGKMKDYDPFKYDGAKSIGGTLRNFFTPITDTLEDTAVNAFYDSGKMYQSYVTPSFMTKLMNKFKLEGQDFEDFILKEYGSSEWFKKNPNDMDISKGWRNEWLRLLARDANARKVFDHKVELNFNKHNYMRNMSDQEYILSLIAEYFAESGKKDNLTPAWYRVPMQSNKPSSEFIKFYSYRGDTYKDSIVNGLFKMFLQEISRIQTVRMRNHSKDDFELIKNFDTNGRKFNFLPVFNAYLENSATDITKRDVLHNADGTISSDNARFAELLQKKIQGEKELSSEEDTIFNNLTEKIIRQSMEDRVQKILDSWEDDGILKVAKSIKDIYPNEFNNQKNGEELISNYIRGQVENFLWNDAFASKNILQLTLSDIAFYKDTEDLQKRLAQLHAPGIRGNIHATDYKGNKVSDGRYRTAILKDFDNFKSNLIANITEVFDRKIAAAPENQKKQLEALKESLVGKDGKYTKINVADAQGYSSPSSYRKKALIFGKWSKHAEDIYQKLLSGEYNYTDLQTAFQPLKPFVYSKLTKDMGVDNAPIHSMQVPFQAKNAEYLLIMADAILKGEELSRPNLLRAIYRVMEDSEKLMPTKGIDTVQFESAIKSGLQGKMDIQQYMEMEGGEEAAYTYMKNLIFKEEYNQTTGERIYQNYNTNTFVHETSYEDYCLQQEVPAHFKEHSQAHGSQIRMITPSDLDFYTTDAAGNKVDNYYEWKEPDGTVRKVKADEFRKEYEDTIAQQIEDSINNLAAELHFNSTDKRERNIALSRILQREIISSSRYGIDLIQACSINKESGEFRIPKGDPIQAKRIEQLINSIIKNRINKQKIAGGPIVQVSNFGTSKQLHIRFKDKQGGLIPLEEEYNPAEHDNKSYKDYIHEHQGGIAYYEVFCPIWANDLFEKFANPDGSINVEAIEATDPELLKMVSYRIPTEDKYSCAPMKVVGFMPREAGDAIMFPYELTEIDDSDFDVDKRYVMRKNIPIKTKKRKVIEDELFKRASESYKSAHEGKSNNTWIGEQVRIFLNNPQKMKNADKFMQWLYSQYQQVAYYSDAPTSGRAYRDNKIIDMTYAVLTNEMTADKILNPGGFDAPRRMGYMISAYKNAVKDGLDWSDLQDMSTEDLKKISYTDKDLTFADTQIQFYKQNSAASSLIGVFAVNKVAHAILESNDIFLDISEVCGDNDGFTIAGTTFNGRMQLDVKYDSEGNLIGKTLGSLVSASADAVKDPILNLMNINMTTAGMLNSMLRLGMTFEDAALFLSQDIIGRLLDEFNRVNLTNYDSLGNIIDKWLIKFREKNDITNDSNIDKEGLTKEELIEGLTSKKHEEIDYKVLLAFKKLQSITDAIRKPTFATRFNSISSAVGPLIIDNLILEHRKNEFLEANAEDGTSFYTADGINVDIDDIFFDHPVLKQFARTIDIAKSLFSDMPAGSTGFRGVLNKLPKDISDKVYGDKKLLDQLSNFYQSYLLVQSGMINSKNTKRYIDNFPKWFSDEKIKEKYADNALIQAIRMKVSRSTGKPYLQINLTGLDEQSKEELRSAWIDLHKADPELSRMLFEYSFFRAGVGFSPKTFMALVPTFVKERLKSRDGSTSYVDTYRNFPTVIPELVVDQFIRNNWNNNKLAPWKGGKDTHYSVDIPHKRLVVYNKNDKRELSGLSYMKTKANGNAYLWHFKGTENDNLVFELVKPLGNNGEYLEMSTSKIDTPLSETTKTAEDNETSDIKSQSPQESTAVETPVTTVNTTETVRNLAELADLIMLQNPKLDRKGAEKMIYNIKGKEKMFAKFLQNVFKHKGLDLNENDAINEFKKQC